MLTWTKRLLFLGLVFLGLYFFGDFTVNGVNVRDKLQSWIPPEIMKVWTDKAQVASQNAVKTVKDTLNTDSGSNNDKIQPQNQDLDQISAKDQEKFKDLMKRLQSEESSKK